MNPVHLFRTAILAGILTCTSAPAAEPFLKKGDVIALVGGEDMVAASEYGYLELLLQRALPDYRLQFRSLAWEGDTVFEQRRDLNFPPLEAQLEQIGATVVLCQFGQMESLAGKEKLPEFVAAYEKLIARMSGGGKRKIILLTRTPTDRSGTVIEEKDNPTTFLDATPDTFGPSNSRGAFDFKRRPPLTVEMLFSRPIFDFARTKANVVAVDVDYRVYRATQTLRDPDMRAVITRDGIHLDENGHKLTAIQAADQLGIDLKAIIGFDSWSRLTRLTYDAQFEALAPLRDLIVAKNRLWFDYWRPQNWAFLAGDRTSQPSSRDHLDPTKRWFPAEREAFLPLIAAKEEEIWKLATTLK